MALSKWIPVAVPTANGTIWTTASNASFTGGIIAGYSVRNTGAAKMTIDVYDNTTNSGTAIFSVELEATGSAGSSATFYSDTGIKFSKGLYVAVSASTALGSFFVA